MRGSLTNLTCFDCHECVDRNGTSHSFCNIEQEPVGGLDWNNEDFDKFSSHIFPQYAEHCENFKLRAPFAIRSLELVIYITTVDKLHETFTALKGNGRK